MKLSVFAITATALVGACATTDTDPDQPLTAEQANEVECRRVESLGSNLGDRVCMTRAEWQAHDEAEREANQDFLRRNSQAGRNETPPSGFGN